ncbi:22661_t:CDS:10, partial [Gigaspora margarita]
QSEQLREETISAQTEFEEITFTIFKVNNLPEEFQILFTKTIEYRGKQIIAFAIPQTQLGEELSCQLVEILEIKKLSDKGKNKEVIDESSNSRHTKVEDEDEFDYEIEELKQALNKEFEELGREVAQLEKAAAEKKLSESEFEARIAVIKNRSEKFRKRYLELTKEKEEFGVVFSYSDCEEESKDENESAETALSKRSVLDITKELDQVLAKKLELNQEELEELENDPDKEEVREILKMMNEFEGQIDSQMKTPILTQKDKKFQKALKIFEASQFMEKIKKVSEKTGINPFAEPQNLITEEKQKLAQENITKAKNRETELVRAVNKAKKEYEDLIAAGEKALEEGAKDEANEAKKSVEKLTEEKQILTSDLTIAEQKLKTTEEQKSKLSLQIKDLTNQAQAWELQKEDISRQINQKDRTITSLQHEVELLQTEVNNYQEKAVEVAKRLKENRTLVSPEKVSLEVLEKERKAHLILIGASQVEIQNKTNRLNSLKTDIENLKQEAANLGKVIRTKRTEIFDLVKKLNKAHNLMTELERQLAETREKVEQLEQDKSHDNEDKVKEHGELKEKIILKDAEIRSKQTEINNRDSQLTAEKSTLQTEKETLEGQLRERDNQLEQAIKQKRLGNLFSAGVFITDYLPIPGKWQEGIKAVFYRIFGRKERNQIKELRTQLQETRTELLLTQNQLRSSGEKVSEIRTLSVVNEETELEAAEGTKKKKSRGKF